MRRWFSKSVYGVTILVLLAGCTSSRWIADKEPALDKTDGKVLASNKVLSKQDEVTPDDPVLTLDLLDVQKVDYPQRLVMKRYIQKFRPRYGHLILGLAASGFIFYTAHTHGIIKDGSSSRAQLLLNTAGLAIGVGSLLNMKPVGTPRPTGEVQMTKVVGHEVRIDTTNVKSDTIDNAEVTVSYGDSLVALNKKVSLTDGKLTLNLARNYNPGVIKSIDPDSLMIDAYYQKNRYQFSVPIRSFMQRYALITDTSTALYNEAKATQDNLLTDVSKGTYLQFMDNAGKGWYKVLLGITPAYLNANSARIVWKTSANQESDVLDKEASGYGSVDVENNIPQSNTKQPGTTAFLLASSFSSQIPPLQPVYERDIHLMRDYLNKAMGIPAAQIHAFGSAQGADAWKMFRDTSATPSWFPKRVKSPRVVIYYTGVASGRKGSNAGTIVKLIRNAAKWKTSSTILILDVRTPGQDPDSLKQKWIRISAQMTAQDPKLTVLLSSDIGQNAQVYRSSGENVDKMHSIFTYYFCRALQAGMSQMASITRFLQRNIAFTSRSITNQPQDPVFLGNTSVSLTGSSAK
ncbi:MAG TPA: hypothetical protein VKA08_01450 [Balneolales bacterium]|nr:hypothetical protein [Balneolales bacterium]